MYELVRFNFSNFVPVRGLVVFTINLIIAVRCNDGMVQPWRKKNALPKLYRTRQERLFRFNILIESTNLSDCVNIFSDPFHFHSSRIGTFFSPSSHVYYFTRCSLLLIFYVINILLHTKNSEKKIYFSVRCISLRNFQTFIYEL